MILRPHLFANSLADVDPLSLAGRGIRVVGFDKDNCLTLPHRQEVYSGNAEAVSRYKRTFGLENLFIFSNSSGSRGHPNPETIDQIRVIDHGTKKPFGGKILRSIFKDVKPNQIAFIGDRIFTDVAFAKINGFYTILVNPIDASGESPSVYVIRRIEKLFI